MADATGPKKSASSRSCSCAPSTPCARRAEAIARHYFGKSIYVQSAGVRSGEPATGSWSRPWTRSASTARSTGRAPWSELEEWEGLNFDLIVTLSPEAHHAALELTRTLAADVEYWPTADPTIVQGSRDQRLDAYRDVRDGLTYRIKMRLKG